MGWRVGSSYSTFFEKRVALGTGDLPAGCEVLLAGVHVRLWLFVTFIDFSLALVFFLVPFPEPPECCGEG